MRVFVANPTLQHRDFQYRIPGVNTPRVLKIVAGGQAQIPGDLAGSELQNVIRQLEALGAVPKGDIRAIVMPKALVYEVAPKPIDPDTINEGLERDEMARQEVAGQKMEEAGLAAFSRAQANGAHVVETSMEVVEVTDRGPVKDSVNMEVVVSSKPGRRAGRKRVETKASAR